MRKFALTFGGADVIVGTIILQSIRCYACHSLILRTKKKKNEKCKLITHYLPSVALKYKSSNKYIISCLCV